MPPTDDDNRPLTPRQGRPNSNARQQQRTPNGDNKPARDQGGRLADADPDPPSDRDRN